MPAPPLRAVLGLGSNLGSREALLRAAADLLGRCPGVVVHARSHILETAPVGPAQPDYLNAALLVETTLAPADLLAAARTVEALLGRERRVRWDARTVDIDVLWIDGVAVDSAALTVPHPELARRRFALDPLLELVPDARHPVTGAGLAAVLAGLPEGTGRVQSRAAFAAACAGEEVEHTADESFVVRARDRADLLAGAAEALGTLVADPAGVAPVRRVAIEVGAPDGAEADGSWPDDERLFAWLSEVLFHIDARGLALRRAVVFADEPWVVRGALFGEDLDEDRHVVRGALKAVTYHGLDVGVSADGTWRAQVVIDI